jgi:hypothetical protein
VFCVGLQKRVVKDIVSAVIDGRPHWTPMEHHKLALLTAPSRYSCWAATRRGVITTLSVLPSLGDGASVALLRRELLFSQLLLSKFCKDVDIWSHRLWLWNQLATALRAAFGANPSIAERISMELTCAISDERSIVDWAMDKHPMNMNGWQYRRAMVRLMSSSFVDVFCRVYRGFGLESLGGDVAVFEVLGALQFLRAHHADGSCASFIVSCVDQLLLLGHRQAASLWGRALQLNTRLLTRSAFVGHETLWVMRLGLMAIALKRRRSESNWACGGWTVRDEMMFIEAHSGGATLMDYSAASSGFHGVSWVDCCGSTRWHAFYSLRYGVEVTKLLL